jgi:ELWxxDGT repeat protein
MFFKIDHTMKNHLITLIALLFVSPLFSQLVLERDINQEPASSNPTVFTALNNILYFSADDGIHGDELYQHDLNTGVTELVANLRPYEDGNGISTILAFDGKIYFNARDGIGNNFYLYVYDPQDGSVQRLMDANGIEVEAPENLYAFNGKMIFAAEFNGIDTELGLYDPVANTVEILADINENGSSYPNFFTEYDGKLWFWPMMV